MICATCQKELRARHANQKRCKPCARKLVKRPASNLTPAQRKAVLELRGKVPRHEIARQTGVSLASIARLGRELGVSFLAPRYSKALIAQVIAHYEQHGGIATRKRFPEVNLRSIVERYAHEPLQARWTDRQMAQAVRMSGIVPHADQARFFARPNARAGSIKSFWWKRLGVSDGYMHGLPLQRAEFFLRPGFPITYVPYSNGAEGKRPLVLWVHIEKYMEPWAPDFIRDAIRTMARFQKWIFNSEHPDRSIKYMLKTKVSA